MSTDAPWRVYLPEWLVVYTSDASGGLEGGGECRKHFRDKYQGRVRDEDWRAIPAIFGAERESYRPYCLQLYAPNLRGEFKDRDDAWELWGELKNEPTANPEVVQRGSDREQALLSYGKKMLPATGVDGSKG